MSFIGLGMRDAKAIIDSMKLGICEEVLAILIYRYDYDIIRLIHDYSEI